LKKEVLLIISHTEHFRNKDGAYAGWSSTVHEIDQLSTLFSKVIHIACLYNHEGPAGMAAYRQSNVIFKPIPPYGGKGWRKLSVLWTAPQIIFTVFRHLREASYFHLRLPTSMGIYLIPLLTIFSRKPGWFKYAGNWIQKKPPLSYRWQRFFLTKLQGRIVTVNGNWPDSPIHVIGFENPCLYEQELKVSHALLIKKIFLPPFNFCFVGRVDESKGFDILLEALKQLGSQWVRGLMVIGLPDDLHRWKSLADHASFPVLFLGYLSRKEVLEYLKQSHFMVLPSQSEGFPKVVAEAWSVGCIPIVSEVSSIGQYVYRGVNGFTIPFQDRTVDELLAILNGLKMNLDFSRMLEQGLLQAQYFTFEYYLRRIKSDILPILRHRND
jgi:glycosyltransferase involved in cell wall biosynthesis